jgi:SAM-dependent methyltransferase
VVGIELSPTAAAYGRQHLRLDVYQSDLLDAPLAEGRFDAAVLWHVLEHTHDPRTQLDRLLALLRPGGILGLRVPNMHSFGARVAGRSWPWIAPPGHLWYFSPHTLPRLLARCGFEVLDVRTLRGDGENPYYHMLAGIGSRANALRRILARSRASSGAAPGTPNPPQLQGAWLRLLGRARPVTAALARLTAPVVGPLEQAGWGDELLCYARRPA